MALNIITCVKETYDVDHIKIDSTSLDPILQGIPVEIEDLSKNALEAAVQLKEKHEGKVTVVSVASPKTIKKSMKEALAMGADEGFVVTHEIQDLNPAATALVLAHGLKSLGNFDLIVMGEGSADNYSGQMAPRVAEILGLPLVSYVCGIEVKDTKLLCATDLEDCYEIVEVSTPSIVAVTNEINEPRLPSLTHILKASKKPMKDVGLDTLGLSKELLDSAQSSTKIVRNKAPRVERKNIKFEGEPDEVLSNLISALSKDGYIGR